MKSGAVGRSVAVFRMVAILRSAFRVLSSACKDGVVDDGGAVSIVMISVVACLENHQF